MTPRTVAIVQARVGSTRLHGKVLLPLLGEPMLTHVMRRVARAQSVDQVVLATTTLVEDDALVVLAEAEGWQVERGSETDLLERYLEAARSQGAGVIVRVTSDCPMIDPEVIDMCIAKFAADGADYASNTLEPRTYPRGVDVEVVSMEALETAGREDHDPVWREHATPYIYRHPEKFRLVRIVWPDDQSDHRWTVDMPEDYELVRHIYDALGSDDFDWQQALEVVRRHPEWHAINRDVQQKVVPSA